MPKVQPDLQMILVTSAAVTGIGLFWAELTHKCVKTIYSLVKNQFLYEEEDVQEEEDKHKQKEEDVQELKKNLMESIEITNQWFDQTEHEQEGEDKIK